MQNMRLDKVSMTKNCWTGLGLVVGLRNGQLGQILFGDSVQGFRDTAEGLGMHIWRSGRSELGSGVIGDCLGGSELSLDTTRVCPGLVGCHGYDTSAHPSYVSMNLPEKSCSGQPP